MEQYKIYDRITHVLKHPRMYIGDIMSENKIAPGLEAILLAGLRNAEAAVIQTLQSDRPYIEVFIDDNVISYENNGKIVSVVKNNDGLYLPEMIFGELRYVPASITERYDNQEVNIKYTNIFSKWFTVEIGDSETKLYYFQKWTNNSRIKDSPKIIPYNKPHSYIKITFELDLGYLNQEKLTQHVHDLLYNTCADISRKANTSITINGKDPNIHKIPPNIPNINNSDPSPNYTAFKHELSMVNDKLDIILERLSILEKIVKRNGL